VSIGDALARVQAELGLPETDALRALTDAWENVVGVDVAAHARLEAVRDETISIAVDGTLWATQLLGSRVVRGIRVRVEPRA
jgi:predicted nucleic acid-binding Zn ribbon protein